MSKNERIRKIAYRLVPPLYLAASRLLFKSCRIELFGLQYRQQCEARQPFIVTFWHYGMYFIIQHPTPSPMVAMVSASTDGEYISRLLTMLGFTTVRGSKGPGKGGVAALKEMIRHMRQGKTAAIVADGSQGPPLKAQPGAILLASLTGAPILPMAWAADRYWVIRSWDRSVVPKPFARISLGYGEPLHVPARVNDDEVEKFRSELETRLNRLYAEAWSRYGRRGH